MSKQKIEEFLADKDDHEVVMCFQDRMPSTVNDLQPYESTEGKNYSYYFHAGELAITSTGNEDKTFYENFVEPLPIKSQQRLLNSLDTARYGKFMFISCIDKKFKMEQIGDWTEDEESGVFFSSTLYRQKKTFQTYTHTQTTPPISPRNTNISVKNGRVENRDIGEVSFLGLKIYPVTDALRKYFQLDDEVEWFIGEDAMDGKFKEIDFITSIQGSTKQDKSFFERLNKRMASHKKIKALHVHLLRYNMLEWSDDRNKRHTTKLVNMLSPIYLSDSNRKKLKQDLTDKKIDCSDYQDIQLLTKGKELGLDMTIYFAA